MKKACLFVHKPYQKNEIFNQQSVLNRDQCLAFFHQLKKYFYDLGVDLQTQDMNSPEQSEFVIFSEMPNDMSEVLYPEKSYVFLFESELIRPNDWKLENHRFFKKIFTWNDDLVDNVRYFKFNFSHAGTTEFLKHSDKGKLCTLIAGHKYVSHSLELYSYRIKAIRWFEQNHPDDFEFYGVGWSLHTFDFKNKYLSRILNKIIPLRKFFSLKWPSYKGSVQSKIEVLKKYKFSICFENARDITGYITEKIFDSLAAGCIPVYWGAPNISHFIPKECYILFTDFNNFEDLFQYLVTMSEAEYDQRLVEIQKYLKSEKHQLFEPAYNAHQVVERILK